MVYEVSEDSEVSEVSGRFAWPFLQRQVLQIPGDFAGDLVGDFNSPILTTFPLSQRVQPLGIEPLGILGVAPPRVYNPLL